MNDVTIGQIKHNRKHNCGKLIIYICSMQNIGGNEKHQVPLVEMKSSVSVVTATSVKSRDDMRPPNALCVMVRTIVVFCRHRKQQLQLTQNSLNIQHAVVG